MDGQVREIPLLGGGVVLVDAEDYDRLAARRWKMDRAGYPIETGVGFRHGGKRVIHYLHHAILPKRAGIDVDHRDGNPRNATRANLRYATKSQNQANRHHIRTRTGIKGVTLHRQTGKYQAQVKRDGRNHYLGLYTCPVAAGRAYIRRARELFGEFAWSNVAEDEAA